MNWREESDFIQKFHPSQRAIVSKHLREERKKREAEEALRRTINEAAEAAVHRALKARHQNDH